MAISSHVAGAAAWAPRRARAAAVATAVTSALLVWLLAEAVLGIDVRAPAFDASGSWDIGPMAVLLTSAGGALAGWGVLAGLERFTRNAARIWGAIAVAFLVLSFGGPLSGTGVDTAQRVVLLSMHIVVGGALIPALYLSAARRQINTTNSRIA